MTTNHDNYSSVDCELNQANGGTMTSWNKDQHQPPEPATAMALDTNYSTSFLLWHKAKEARRGWSLQKYCWQKTGSQTKMPNGREKCLC